MAKNGINKAIVMGRLGQDPETRYTQGGDAVTTLSIATGESWKDKTTGEKKETTEWHRVILWRKLAEIAAEYCKKGGMVYIEGKLATRKWTDKDGVDRYTTEIIADEMQLIGGKQEQRSEPQDSHAASYEAQMPKMPASKRPAGDDFEDDIPFMRIQHEYTY